MNHLSSTILLLTFGIVTFIAAASPSAAQDATRSILGIDISGSSTFLVDQRSADAAGEFVEKYIAGLDAPHELHMVSLGEAGLARRAIDVKATVTKTRASSARKLAPQFGDYFRALPSMAERGEIAAQNTTSLVAFFHSLEPICEGGNTSVIVFTDGLEWSDEVDGRAFAAGKTKLPKPERAFLKGCRVTMLGVGQVKSALSSDGLEQRLIPAWRDFLTDAGADAVAVRGAFFSF